MGLGSPFVAAKYLGVPDPAAKQTSGSLVLPLWARFARSFFLVSHTESLAGGARECVRGFRRCFCLREIEA